MKKMILMTLACFCASIVLAQDDKDAELKYFLLIGTPEPAVLQAALDNPADFGEAAKKELESLGGELLGYFFAMEHAKNYALMALPGSEDMAALVYQRMATGAMKNIEVVELIPSDRMVEVFKQGQEIATKP